MESGKSGLLPVLCYLTVLHSGSWALLEVSESQTPHVSNKDKNGGLL